MKIRLNNSITGLKMSIEYEYNNNRTCQDCGVNKMIRYNFVKNTKGEYYKLCQDCRPLNTRRRDEILFECEAYRQAFANQNRKIAEFMRTRDAN